MEEFTMTPVPGPIQQMFDRLMAAWKSNDGSAVAGLFTQDASLINPFGERADGRDAVATMYGSYFDGMLKDTTTAITVSAVRLIDERHAFVDSEQQILGPDGSVLLPVHFAVLLRREGDAWQIADGRPYSFGSMPG
jgi:uncharacterized protein (TIGR02246 family)